MEFSVTFLIFFHQLALGGLFALAATPFHELDRAFYKSTGAVLLVMALFSFGGRVSLYLGAREPLRDGGAALILDALFVAAFVCYLVSLWLERPLFRARSFSTAILSGTAALALSAGSFARGPVWSLESLIYPVSFVLSALLLGSVTVGMLIGHWYLIDTGQSIEPFVRIFRFFVKSLATQTGFLVLCGLLFLATGGGTAAAIARAWESHPLLLAARFLVGQAAPLFLSWMIWKTLLIPHTMAATGLFYIALLGVFVGEILGKQLLALTSLPF
ncbi:MAG TPA: hypothetical protein VNN77_05155 [candidate division Zixibacteria bacterium]|nr:hypothetical protein [candidate division Zixibacteria bacterium]